MRILLAAILLSIFNIGNASKRRVCESCDIKNLKQAVAISEPGDTIVIGSGIYICENLEITKPLTIIGEEGATLDGKMTGYVLKLLADSIHISGLKIINAGRSYTKDYAAIYTFKANYFIIENNVVADPFFGLLIEKSKYGTIRNNVVYGTSVKEDETGNGIHGWHCSNLEVYKNEVYNMRDGIYLEFVDDSKITDNHTHNNIRYGLHFMFSNRDQYLNNRFERNGAGVAVMFSKFIVMKQNQFVNNWGPASYGLLLKEIYDAEVVDNEFTENTMAVFIDGTTRINYTGNVFKKNGWAIKVSGGCYANRIYGNDFVGNSFDVSYNSKMNDNTFDGNYWGDYTGYDLDKDGVGDVPYRPVKLFSYIVNKTPETIILLRSLFVDIMNFSERVSPVFTPDNLVDQSPSMRAFK
ncbi:nitrous oxide reductase family maturation protein NosD [Ekhidna sp. To15]|uniref:nitrous oxide reductase family maturation protein NosD n=1 Tax=Ekhidna sp. To15 TaxID=3395267 RepID=UPI003F51D8AE